MKCKANGNSITIPEPHTKQTILNDDNTNKLAVH